MSNTPEEHPGESRTQKVQTQVDAIRRVDLSGIHSNQVTQLLVGWLYAVCGQIDVILLAKAAGRGEQTAPNLRLVVELVQHIAWVASEKQSAADAVIRASQDSNQKMATFMDQHSPAWRQQMAPQLLGLGAIPTDPDSTMDNRAKFKHLAQHLGSETGPYDLWWRATQFAHATALLGFASAPVIGTGLEYAALNQLDSDDTILTILLTQAALITANALKETDPSQADALLDAYWPEPGDDQVADRPPAQ